MLTRALAALALLLAPTMAAADAVTDTRQLLAAQYLTQSTKDAYLSGSRDQYASFQRVLAVVRRLYYPVVVPPTPAGKPILADDGDSISIFWSGNWTGIYAATRPDIDMRGFAVGGSGLVGAIARWNSTIAPLHPAYYVLMIGANDAGLNYADSVLAHARNVRLLGTRVVIGAVVARGYSTLQTNASVDATNVVIRAYNARMRLAVTNGEVDALIPFDSSPRIGTAAGMKPGGGASSDGTHPDSAYPEMAAIAKPYIDAVVDQKPLPAMLPAAVEPTLPPAPLATTLTSGKPARAVADCPSFFTTAETTRVGISYPGVRLGDSFPAAYWGWWPEAGNIWSVVGAQGPAYVAQACLVGAGG